MSESAEELTQLLEIKLHIPRAAPGAVPRPRLLARLNEALAGGSRLTVVVAPAGYGKSTLLADWVSACGRPAGWLSLDRRDNNLASFLRYLVAAVGTRYPDCCSATLRALQAPALPAPEYLAELLAHDLALLPHALILVLDDYHLVRDSAVQACMARLLEILPHHIHLVLAGRFDSPLPLSRFAARGELCELRGDALQFTQTEAAEYLTQRLESRITPQGVGALYARTEGWIAPLCLAVQSLSRDGVEAETMARLMSRADRQLLSYLLQEFLSQQPEPVQDFLVRTSILDRFCAPLCAAVTGDDDIRAAYAFLAELSQSNPLLQSLDDRETWYRYHQLLQDSLRATVTQRLKPEMIAELHRRASTWYATSGFIEEAIEHALAAGDLPTATRLTERFVLLGIEHAQPNEIERHVHVLPRAVQETNPTLLVGEAFIAQARNEIERMPSLLVAAEAGMQRPDWQADDDVRAFVRGMIHMGMTMFYYYTGQSQPCLEHAERAVELTPQIDHWTHAAALYHWARACQHVGRHQEAVSRLREALAEAPADNLLYSQQIVMGLAQVYRGSGEMHRLKVVSRQMLSMTRELGLVLRVSWARMLQGVACYEMNDLEAAIPLFAAVVAEPAVAHHLALRDSVAGLALAYDAQGLVEQASDVVATHVEFLSRSGRIGELTHAHALAALLALRHGDLDAAQYALRLAAIGPNPGVMEWLVLPQLVEARALMAQGDKETVRQAVAICDDLAARAASMHNVPALIRTQAVLATAHEAQGHHPEALGALRKALKLALPGSVVRGILDLDMPANRGASVERLLRTLVEQFTPDRLYPDPLVDYAHQLFEISHDARRSWDEIEAAAASPSPRVARSPADQYFEVLTEREMEVLRLLAQHYSNKEIAAQLVISVGTVKRHTVNIYDKLAANSRREAVASARRLGILPDQ